MTRSVAEGPWFEQLVRGQVFDDLPGLTLTGGRAAAHQAVTGDRLRLSLDDELARAVTGRAPLAHPALVWDVAIGQSTTVTHHVKANLFYRGLVVHRLPAIGDTLRTRVEVVGLRQNRPRPDRAPTGLAALRVTTRDQRDRLVLDFVRCAMIPLRDPLLSTGHADDLDAVALPPTPPAGALVADWDLAAYVERTRAASSAFPVGGLGVGDVIEVGGGDVVSSAPELARLTLNVAQVHHDERAAGGRRLVYGGHTIGLALAQAARALPGLVTVCGWHGCDHLGPVHEGDTLRSRLEIERITAIEDGPGALADLRSTVSTDGGVPVLDWRFVALLV